MTATCRICLEGGEMIQPCKCSGTAANVHPECLRHWLEVSGRTSCEICKYKYEVHELSVRECDLCPPFRMAKNAPFSNLLFVVGFLFFFLLAAAALLMCELFLEILVVVNLLQLLMLLCLSTPDMNAGETLFVWKVMSSLAFLFGSVLLGHMDTAELEWILTGCIGAIVYLKLTRREQTYQVLYLDYINEAEP